MTYWRIIDLLKTTESFFKEKNIPDPRLDAELLLGHILKRNRLELYLIFDQPLDPVEVNTYRALVAKRAKRIPLQHIIGKVEFMGLDFKVSADALIPRPETERLVETVLAMSPKGNTRLIDIGTGTGCIALSLADFLKNAKILAIDISKSAIALAKTNAKNIGVIERVQFQTLDILNALPVLSEKVDFVVSNPPYIDLSEKESMQIEVVEHDPHEALFAKDNGLSFYARFAEILPKLLKPGGHFLFEFGGSHQKKAVLNIFLAKKYNQLEIIQDYNGDPRIIKGKYLE